MSQNFVSLNQSHETHNSNKTNKIFDADSILKQIVNQDQLTVKQLQNQIRQIQYAFKQTKTDLNKCKKQLQLRPTSNTLVENTILLATSFHIDPNIAKMLNRRENDKIELNDNDEQEKLNQFEQLKRSTLNLGRKIAQINDSLPLLFSMIKVLEKQTHSENQAIKLLIEQKTQSLQDQFSNYKNQQLSEKLSMTEKIQNNSAELLQKIRLFETKQTWQLKQMKSRLNQLITKDVFQIQIRKVTEENKKIIQKFQVESISLVNPEKIKQIQKTIKENRQTFTKSIIQCDIKIETINEQIQKSLVNVQFYRKQRTSLEKRISTTNQNFQEFYKKVSKLINSDQIHDKIIKLLEKQNNQKTKQMTEMKKILKNLHITEEFQKMLSKIDPQKILELEGKIQNIDIDNKNLYKELMNTNHEIQKVNSKFQVSGILLPNKARDKEYQLNDLKQIIDQYFVQNRFANKINKIQNALNEGKSNIQTIKVIQKKLARLQKESQYVKIVQDFKRLEEEVRRDLKIFQQKLSNNLSKSEINKSYFQGLTHKVSEKKIQNYAQKDRLTLSRRKSLLSESSYRKESSIGRRFQDPHSESLHKFIPLQKLKKQFQLSFLKNTVSSTKKNLLKSNDLLLGK